MKLNRVRWEIESKCNLNCRHCFVGGSAEEHHEVTKEKAKAIVDNLKKQGTSYISFTTREPLLFDKIGELISYCTKQGIKTDLITNGVLLANLDFAKEIMRSGVENISISLEGLTEETNDIIRGKGTFNKVMKALKNLNSLQEPGNHTHIGIQMCLTRYNYKNIDQIPQLANELPINSLHIGNISIVGNAKENQEMKLSNEEFIEAWERLAASYNKLPVKNYELVSKAFVPFEAVLMNLKYNMDFISAVPSCSIMKDTYSLMPDGSLTPCISLLDKKGFELPRIDDICFYDTKSKNEEFTRFKNHVKDYVSSYKNSTCNMCYFNSSCLPCPSSLSEEKSLEFMQSRCLKAKEKVEIIIDQITNNIDKYRIVMRDNTSCEFEDNKVGITRFYTLGGIVKMKQYNLNSIGVDIIKLLVDKDEVSVEEISGKNHISNEQVITFLKPLLFDNFIFIREDVSSE